MNGHLLRLTAPKIVAAPGFLDAVFGPDGNFEGAPPWTGPIVLFVGKGRKQWAYVLASPSPICGSMYVRERGSEFLSEMGLDLHVPSVAARLAGLCARALDVEATGQAWATETGEIQKDYWALRYCDQDGYAASCAWMKTTGKPDRRSLSPCPVGAPTLPANLPDVPAFLAALTLALAPKIAAL